MNNFFKIIVITLISGFTFSQEQEKPMPAIDILKKYQNVRDFTISKNQDEIYFTIQNPSEERAVIAVIKKKKKRWSEPEMTSFSGNFRNIEPFLTQDGLRLYFASNRPINDTTTNAKDYDIWYVERKDLKSKWSKPINIGAPVNSSNNEFYPCVTLNGNLYFTSDAIKTLGKDDILVCKWDGKQYIEPKNLGMNINSTGYEFNAFVSPNEEFIIYTCYGRPDGLGSGDLYISYKNNKGNWDTAKNLGAEINSKQMDYCPFYDTTTQTLYFTSKRMIVIDKIFTNLKEFETEISSYENGFSRIYKYQIKL
ncbi:TolB-like translocation protein [Flavobacterium cheniae]|uniref:WD40 repeat protein n=1 Tax=Flavobacterium cheniae TaxID=295428 RepID=A0A562KNZ4_9FLAO|nr:PD40 domain-containing protein [Flavobacterium cheniae]TDR23009.1 WD40 repeat protein [Flavobacterium cheniae]TWH97131.1 WD40 repeat protein [Flavobacterium cheniae]